MPENDFDTNGWLMENTAPEFSIQIIPAMCPVRGLRARMLLPMTIPPGRVDRRRARSRVMLPHGGLRRFPRP